MSSTNPLKAALSRATPNTLPDAFRVIDVGQVIRGQIPQVLRQKSGVGALVDPSQLTTLESLGLPEDARASVLIRAQARGGTGAGELTVKTYGTTPGSGEIGVAPNGDIVMLDADSNTGVDVVYLPERGEVVELTAAVVGSVAADTLTIPAALVARGVILLLSSTALVGTLAGKNIVLKPSNSKPATTKANLDLAKANVLFAVADAVTSATVRLLVKPKNADLDDNLEADSPL